jgi:predicted phosphoadenosine phosphosulfate sulfurtransferase
MPVHKKKFVSENVYEESLARFRLLYERYDNVVISFSGGKDSTVCLMLAIQVAEEMGRLPVVAHFWDEEALHPETVEYVQRVANDPRVELLWYCLPIKHRNACSTSEPWWICWDETKRDLWCRELPEQAITELEGFVRGSTIPEACMLPFLGPEWGQVAAVRGLRASESMRRYQAIAKKQGREAWLAEGTRLQFADGLTYVTNQTVCSPIYDWLDNDVWEAPRRFGWDYNRTYDIMAMAGIPRTKQRVCPPYGEEPLGALHIYAECWPELWGKMINRVPGAATAARYARTELYGWREIKLPAGKTWQKWFFELLARYPKETQRDIKKALALVLKQHAKKTVRNIPDEEDDPLTGISWRTFCKLVLGGDLKGRKMQRLHVNINNKRKMTLEEARSLDYDEGRY